MDVRSTHTRHKLNMIQVSVDSFSLFCRSTVSGQEVLECARKSQEGKKIPSWCKQAYKCLMRNVMHSTHLLDLCNSSVVGYSLLKQNCIQPGRLIRIMLATFTNSNFGTFSHVRRHFCSWWKRFVLRQSVWHWGNNIVTAQRTDPNTTETHSSYSALFFYSSSTALEWM